MRELGIDDLPDGLENLRWVLVAWNDWREPRMVGDRSSATFFLKKDVKITFVAEGERFAVQGKTQNDKMTPVTAIGPQAYDKLENVLRLCYT